MPQQKVTVWSVAIDSDNGLHSSAHTNEADAWKAIIPTFTKTDDDRKKAEAFIEARNFDALRDFLGSVIECSRTIDSYSIEKHELTVDIPYPSDAGVSKAERDYSVTITADVQADNPREAFQAFVDLDGILDASGLTGRISSLKTGEYIEIDA